MKLNKILLLLALLLAVGPLQAQKLVVKGKVQATDMNGPLPFATVFVEGSTVGTTTDDNGHFKLVVPDSLAKGETVKIAVSFTGYSKVVEEVNVRNPKNLNIKISPESKLLREVEIVEERNKQEDELLSTRMSTNRIKMKEIEYIPSLGGEVDIIRVLQLLPGVSGGVEGTIGMFVRGGDADQNLVLLDQASLYEFGHLFGFFSVFNIDAVQDMTMIKGGFPAEYGGRLSSVLDINMRTGTENRWHGNGGIGLLSSRLTLDGPIVKDKAHILISGRRTYIDKVASLVNQDIPYYFYDLNTKIDVTLNKKNKLWFTSYYGEDILEISEDGGGPGGGRGSGSSGTGAANASFGFTKSNWVNSLRWQHLFNDKFRMNNYLLNTFFKYDIEGNFSENTLEVQSRITDIGFKNEFQWLRDRNNEVKFGAEYTQHYFKPNIISSTGEITRFLRSGEGDALTNPEFAVFGGLEHKTLGSLLALNGGLRLSGVSVNGKFYGGIEPRFSARYTLNDFSVIKASYSRMYQYLHRVSSSAVALPTDMWYPVTENVKPQHADQVAVAYEYLFKQAKLKFTTEAYYKWMYNNIEYREGANLVLNNDFESELVQGSGNAYGTEFLLRRENARFSGWIAYTLSWSKRQFEELNGGEAFFARYDRRHDISVTWNWVLAPRFNLSATWVYATGSRFTPQTGNYVVPDASLGGFKILPIYADRNSVTMSAAHRLDINIVLKSKPKFKGRWQGEWHIGAYNVYNRTSPYIIQLEPSANGTGYTYTQPGIFGFLPSVAYNFKF